jgi:membrane protease subunit HflK
MTTAGYSDPWLLPEITRERLYLETMERVLGGTDKIILDSTGAASGVVPYISLDELTKRGNPSAQQPSQPQRTQAGVNR